MQQLSYFFGELDGFKNAEKMRVTDAVGATESVLQSSLSRITFSTHSREQFKAVALDLNLINESTGFEQKGILGGNFLKNYCVTFDFQNSRVSFEPIKK